MNAVSFLFPMEDLLTFLIREFLSMTVDVDTSVDELAYLFAVYLRTLLNLLALEFFTFALWGWLWMWMRVLTNLIIAVLPFTNFLGFTYGFVYRRTDTFTFLVHLLS